MQNKPVITQSGKGIKRVVQFAVGGGAGRDLATKIESILSDQPGVGFRYYDTDRPAGLPTTRFFAIEPHHLPEEPDERLALMLRDMNLPLDAYQMYRRQTGPAGIVELPQFSHLATLWKFDDLVRACEDDYRGLTTSVGGSSETILATMSSGAGGTGSAAVRNAGLASRVVCPTETHSWFHFFITTSLLPADRIKRRNRALEHRQLVEIAALMKPGITLRVPGRQTPIHRPGPDVLYILTSSSAAPRTLDDVAQEVAVAIHNLVTQ
jgi:hypothetical protein